MDEIFVYPAMSDQGLPAGGVLDFLLERDGLARWLTQRYRLETLYYGRDFGQRIDARLGGDPTFRRISATPVETAAELLAAGKIVAVYTLGMEYGPARWARAPSWPRPPMPRSTTSSTTG